MQSDMFHLFPTTDAPNGSRGNYPFGVATPPFRDVAINASSKLGSNFVYAPRDSQKGRSARAMLYFVTRHQDYNGFLAGQETILRTWAKQFPPLAEEKKRCADIYGLQFNRNPFIDYPQFLDRITSIATATVAPNVFSLDLPQSAINYGNVVPLTTAIYSFVVVNTGTSILQLTSATLPSAPAGTTLAFVNGSNNDVGLLPGEAKTYYISFTSNNNGLYTGNFTFSTNTPLNTITVPITANVTTAAPGRGEQYRFVEPTIFPNPSYGNFLIQSVSLANLSYSITVRSNVGTTMFSSTGFFDANGQINLDLNQLSAGVYLIELQVGGYRKFMRILVVR
jgi:hypothetical protein